jgi:hypothetical protein
VVLHEDMRVVMITPFRESTQAKNLSLSWLF